MVKGGVVEAQGIQQPSSFDRIEDRMKQLSDKFKALNERPSHSPVTVSPSESSSSGIPDYKVDFANPEMQPSGATVSASTDDRPLESGSVPLKKTSLESEFGSYYFQVFGGYLVPGDVSFSSQTGGVELDADPGSQVGILAGRRLGNWLGEFQVAYSAMDYVGFKDTVLTYDYAGGDARLIELGLKVSYGVPVGTFAWAYFGVGGGLALRNDSFSAGLHSKKILVGPSPITIPAISLENENSDNAVYLVNAFFGLGYAFTETFNARTGYRFAFSGKNDAFGSMSNHLFEIALGGSF